MKTARQVGRMCAWMPLVAATLCQAQDADAQNRAQRDAQNPLRMIIEASKLKPRAKTGEAEPAAKPAAEKPTARPAPATAGAALQRPPAGERVSPAPPPQAAAATMISAATVSAATVSAAAPAPADRPVAEAPAALAIAATPVPDPVPPAEPVAATPPPAAAEAASDASTPEPAREPVAPQTTDAPLQVARAATALPALAAPAAPRAALQLVDYVEPQLPERVRRRLRADGEVLLGFTVNADGTVTDVQVRSTSDSALDPIALDAVRQWRYQPIATAQAHAVQLVFRRE